MYVIVKIIEDYQNQRKVKCSNQHDVNSIIITLCL